MAEEIIVSGVVKDILKVVDDLKKIAHHLEKFAAELLKNISIDKKSENKRKTKSKSNDEDVDPKITAASNDPLVKCEFCDNRFNKMSDLENHIKTKHKLHQTYDCEKCQKKFLTKWRLNKNGRMHAGIRLKQCKYVKNKEPCPFQDLGCKFEHSEKIDRKEDISEILNDQNKDTFKIPDIQNHYLFFTSTPRKHKLKCQDCNQECTRTCQEARTFFERYFGHRQAALSTFSLVHDVP